jgi:sugar (pentulose or hexulose) kinase
VQHVFATLCELPVVVTDAAEAVATGACVQAAVVATGERPEAIADRWALARSTPVERLDDTGTDDAAAVRARYAELRHAAYPSA